MHNKMIFSHLSRYFTFDIHMKHFIFQLSGKTDTRGIQSQKVRLTWLFFKPLDFWRDI